jgi:hypothetical protein
MIFSDVPDPRLVTIRRGGTVADHHLRNDKSWFVFDC